MSHTVSQRKPYAQCKIALYGWRCGQVCLRWASGRSAREPSRPYLSQSPIAATKLPSHPPPVHTNYAISSQKIRSPLSCVVLLASRLDLSVHRKNAGRARDQAGHGITPPYRTAVHTRQAKRCQSPTTKRCKKLRHQRYPAMHAEHPRAAACTTRPNTCLIRFPVSHLPATHTLLLPEACTEADTAQGNTPRGRG